MKSKIKAQFSVLPVHIGFIMDGNGRWAQKRLLPRQAGHKAGVETLKKTVKAAFDTGIKYISVYAFSTENSKRPEGEKQSLFSLIKEYFSSSLNYFIENKIQIRFMGDLSYFAGDIREILEKAQEKSAGFNDKVLNIALNYGSRSEIIRAVNIAVQNGEAVDEQSFKKLLYTGFLPDPDLIIRTSGECRLSNFMMYQSAYSELIFTETLWPDFDEKCLEAALKEFEKRNRRFGSV